MRRVKARFEDPGDLPGFEYLSVRAGNIFQREVKLSSIDEVMDRIELDKMAFRSCGPATRKEFRNWFAKYKDEIFVSGSREEAYAILKELKGLRTRLKRVIKAIDKEIDELS